MFKLLRPRSRNIAGEKLAWVLALGLAATGAQAQDFQRIAPKPVPQAGGPTPSITPPAAGPAQGKADQQVLPLLLGLVLIDSATKLRGSADAFVPAAAQPELRGSQDAAIRIENLPLLDQADLRAQLADFLGRKVTFGDLTKISQIITAWYRSHHYPFVDVVFPDQDVNTGVIQAVVTEFRLGQKKVQGNQWFSDDVLLNKLRAETGDRLNSLALQDDLNALNQNPFRRVSIVASRSATPGATDLTLSTEDRLPLRAYAGYDNTGTSILGYDRWNLGFNWGDVFGLDQQLAYQFTSSSDFVRRPGQAVLAAHSLEYLVPLPWHDNLYIFGSYAQVKPRLGPDLGLTGVSGQASARYILSLPTLDLGNDILVSGNAQFGYDFKTSNNDLSFGGIDVADVTTEVDQFPVTYNVSVGSFIGQTAISNTFVWSPGNMTPQNQDALFQAQANTPFARAKYVYDTLRVTQTTPLPGNLTSITKFVAQDSDSNLLPSEQLGAGGHDSVRGYDERAAEGSLGVLLSEELRMPAFAIFGNWLPPELGDQAQLLAFWDYGSVRDRQFTPGTPRSIQLSSLGLGVRYTVSRFVDLRFDYGWQQLKLPGAPTTGRAAHLSLTVGY